MPERHDSSDLPSVSSSKCAGAERLAVLVPWLCGTDPPRLHSFHAGDCMIEEGQSLERYPALFVIEGEFEESIGSYAPESGPGVHTVHVAGPGDLVNVQAIVSPHCHEPARYSVHAITDSSCYLIWLEQVERKPEARALFATFYTRLVDMLERERAWASECDALAVRLQEQETQQKGGRLSIQGVLDEWTEEELDEVKKKLEITQDELERAQASVWGAKEQYAELSKKLDLERRARAALEHRVLEMMQELAGQQSPDPRFPTAIRILESAELEELESQARRHREMAENYEVRARMIHRAVELLVADNPGLVIKADVMQLMMGEEPVPRDETEPAVAEPVPVPTAPRRDTVPFEKEKGSQPEEGPKIPRPAPLPRVPLMQETDAAPVSDKVVPTAKSR